jgi:hypothetical protein
MVERIRILKKRQIDRDLEKLVGGLVFPVGREMGVIFLQRASIQPSPGMTVHLWQEYREKQPIELRLIEDSQMPARIISVSAPSFDQVHAALEIMSHVLKFESKITLKQQARKPNKDPGALMRLALTIKDEPDAEASEILIQSLGSRTVDVRIAAASAMGVLRSKHYNQALTKALQKEKDSTVLKVITAALENCSIAS